MFRALLCSSPGGQNCIIQHLVSSHSVGGRYLTGWLESQTRVYIYICVCVCVLFIFTNCYVINALNNGNLQSFNTQTIFTSFR